MNTTPSTGAVGFREPLLQPDFVLPLSLTLGL